MTFMRYLNGATLNNSLLKIPFKVYIQKKRKFIKIPNKKNIYIFFMRCFFIFFSLMFSSFNFKIDMIAFWLRMYCSKLYIEKCLYFYQKSTREIPLNKHILSRVLNIVYIYIYSFI